MARFPPLPPLFPDIHSEKITSYFSSLPICEKHIESSDIGKINLRGSYFLCFTNRCGSNYVAQAISSDGKLMQAGENVNYNTVISHSQEQGLLSFSEYFSWLANATKGASGIFGCKVSVGQLIFLYNEGILQKLSPSPKFIHVIRRDTIAQAISHYIAIKTNKWTSEQKGRENIQIDYDVNTLLGIVRATSFQNAMFESIFKIMGVEPTVVYYEEFLESPQEAISQIGQILGVQDLAYVSPNIHYKKQANEINDSLIEKFCQEFKL